MKIKSPFWYNQRFRNTAIQCLIILFVATLIYFLAYNLRQNLQARGIASGFSFLNQTSGFNIIMHLIDFSERSTYLRAFWVGLINTLMVSAFSIVLATVIGGGIGLISISRNKIWSKCAVAYVEVIRNIPLLLQLLFWYFVVLRSAPYPTEAISLANVVFITNRGLYLPSFEFTGMGAVFISLSLLFLLTIAFTRRFFSKNVVRLGISFFIGMGMIGVALLPLHIPYLGRFNFEGGIVLIPEFMALVIALSLYTAAYIATIVRMGILSISRGQTEAGLALGLSTWQILKHILLPQALKVILPSLCNQYLNLTKNSSLAAAVAYPDLVSVFAGTVLNQTGQAVEIIAITMAVYLVISLTISFFMMLYEKRLKWSIQ
ncbi:ABC transporter permease subunit [Candidatus Berkiella cookevillensis]|uniref:ABC transporter permease subunit n=1 Tax=Candidatus Berkiella cookevillensis TaxID=437022 RepID=A0A0Q9YTA1_9GAMM|nr:ABC transporter permease subunit [Candidatus Berkiella cookevillensis]MCS5708540.1 ABC transporter permease subunit [Candidatus Berkiella cookevillensis]